MSINLMKVLADVTIEAYGGIDNYPPTNYAHLSYQGIELARIPIGFIDWGEEDADQKAADLLIEKLAELLQKAELND